jgi:hypothetical protein
VLFDDKQRGMLRTDDTTSGQRRALSRASTLAHRSVVIVATCVLATLGKLVPLPMNARTSRSIR